MIETKAFKGKWTLQVHQCSGTWNIILQDQAKPGWQELLTLLRLVWSIIRLNSAQNWNQVDVGYITSFVSLICWYVMDQSVLDELNVCPLLPLAVHNEQR